MVELYEHQRAALERLHNGSILWGGVGSGKSITGIAYYCEKVCEGMKHPRDLYIITTARKRDTGEWEQELTRFGSLRAVIDSWNNIHKYVDISGAFFLFDEQRVIGYGAWTKAFLKITGKNQWILLSATPGDCWLDYMPVFIANGFYRNATQFKREHVLYNMYNKRFPQIKGYVNERILIKHRDDILVGMSYEKRTVQHHETIKTAYDKAAYIDIIRRRWNPYKREPIADASELCFVLRRLVNTDPDRMKKIEQIVLKQRKCIIFYNYNYELDMLRIIASRISWPCAEWNGLLHQPIPDTGRWMYLVQYTAGAEGWNCIETDTIIFYSQSYSYKAMVQAAGRIDRINTGYHDLYYYYFTTDSKIDCAMRRALKEKKNFNESAFAGRMFAKKY